MAYSTEFQSLLKTPKVGLHFVWLALTASIPLYAIIPYMITASGYSSAAPSVEIVFASLAVLFAFSAPILRRLLLSDESLLRVMKSGGIAEQIKVNQSAVSKDSERTRLLEVLSENEKRLFAAALYVFVPNLLSLALNEAIAILGLVHALMMGQPSYVLPYAGAAILLNLSMRPDIELVLERASALLLRNEGLRS